MLITLAIIGIVAALTIPTVVNNYQKTQTVTKLKKVYNTLNQAVQMSTVENGSVSGWDWSKCTPVSGANSIEWTKKYILPYLKIQKDCKNLSENCIKQKFNLVQQNLSAPSFYYYGFVEQQNLILADGTGLSFTCSGTKLFMIIDIDGPNNGPNRSGRDRFALILEKDDNGKITECKTQCGSLACKKDDNGGTCFGKIMKDGWQIKDDYPW